MVVNCRVESTWPAVGSVLVHDGKLLAHAGRGSEADGGIAVVQLDPATGKTVWAGLIPPGPKRRNDLLRVVGGQVVCNATAVDPTSGISQTLQVKSATRSRPMLDGYLGRFKMRGFSTSQDSRAVACNCAVLAHVLPVGGRVQLVDKADAKRIIASLKLESAPIYDALAIAGGKVFVTLENGAIVCLGDRK